MTAFTICPSDLALLGILNSSVVRFLFPYVCATIRGDFLRFKTIYVEQIPIPATTKPEAIESLVNKILAMKNKKPTADVSELERQIDRMVYDLYGLTEEERQVIEGSVSKA